MSARCCCCCCYFTVVFLLSAPSFLSLMLVTGEQVALVEVVLRERRDASTVLQGEVLEASLESRRVTEKHDQQAHDFEGDLILVPDEDRQLSRRKGKGVQAKDQKPWIGVVPVKVEESKASTSGNNQESFAAAVVNKMKRALVLGASALIILALNQNTVREMDLSQVLSKPIIIIQTSENVTKLIGALLRGLHATAKITYKTILQDNLGATLTLWSTCGLSRGGLYGEWQGVICTGETNTQVQYLQQLWNTVLLVALILCTGVIVQARWQYQDNQLNDDLEVQPGGVISGVQGSVTKTGHPEETVVLEDQEIPPAQTAVRPGAGPGRRNGELCCVSGAVQQQPVSSRASLPPRVPPGLRGSVADVAAHLPTV
ncbi:uncharacterized protein rnf215 isoform X3 [Esox lucius]|uniref:uncharacterized protein rnf215 isoform X3 n=1 Tax=Esox lucius TaxID=8010 RepID=UPI000661B04C|nr:uncharacterized protein rnf215 isoform X3 [Esox lucius]